MIDATDGAEAADDAPRGEPQRWYRTIGGALTTVYTDSRSECYYRCAGCGGSCDPSRNRRVVQAGANDHAASCRAAPDPRIQHASDIARAIIVDLSAELPRIDAKASAGIALSVALLVGLVSTQKPSNSPVFVAAVVGGVFLTLALLLFLCVLLSERAATVRGSALGQATYVNGQSLLANLVQWDPATYYAATAMELSEAARAKTRRLKLAILSSAFAVMSFVFGVGTYFIGANL